MYSKKIVELRLRAAKKAGHAFRVLPREECIEIAQKLELLRYDKNRRLIPDNGFIRPLMKDEVAFINSEQLLCRVDFEYFIERYSVVDRDPGLCDPAGVGAAPLLPSQRRYIKLLGDREEECQEEKKKYGKTTGIKALLLKCRQVAATSTFRSVTMHRMTFWPGTRCLAASIDAPRVGELYKRDQLIIDGLPFWLRPEYRANVKDTELGFAHPNNSRLDYQAENQQQGRGGLGVGTQIDVSHLTEVPLWQSPGFIKFSLMPALPKAITTLHVQEGTSNGKGNYWHEVTEAVRRKDRGFEDWSYMFIPWWYNVQKYSVRAPASWAPEETTVQHGQLIERTSPEYNDGVTFVPSRDQLYYWETARAEHVKSGELATFLTNYPATPEQSFQNPSQGALPPELIEWMQAVCGGAGVAYNVNLN